MKFGERCLRSPFHPQESRRLVNAPDCEAHGLDVGEGRQQLAATQAQRGSMAVTASAMAIAATPPRASGSGETGDPSSRNRWRRGRALTRTIAVQ